MGIRRVVIILIASSILAVTQTAGAVGLSDVDNAHTGKQLKDVTEFNDALKGGKPDLLLRLRYEDVSDKIPAGSPLAGTDDADLLSLRTVLGYSSGRWHGFYGRVEFEAVTHIGDANALTVGDDFTFPPGPVGSRVNAGHSIIPDPEAEEINEAYFGWRSGNSCPSNARAEDLPALRALGSCDGSTTVKVGRQTIIYDNHRWVGNIAWRQNNQSFDAIRLDNNSIANLSASYTYLDQVNRLFGSDSPFNKFEMNNSHLINISYKTPLGKLIGYGYLLDFDDNPRTPFPEGVGAVGTPGIANFDSKTFGLRFVGKYKASDAFSLLYQLEFANQDPWRDANPALSDNNYYLGEIGGAFKVAGKPVVLKLGYEVLEGNGVNALQTPLATVHAFNGWTDKFVGAPGGSATPPGGLKDLQFTAVVKGLWGKSNFVFQYHDFKADTAVAGVKDYGSEWGVMFAKPFARQWLGLVKYAEFSDGGDGFSFDTKKWWLMGQYSFK